MGIIEYQTKGLHKGRYKYYSEEDKYTYYAADIECFSKIMANHREPMGAPACVIGYNSKDEEVFMAIGEEVYKSAIQAKKLAKREKNEASK